MDTQRCCRPVVEPNYVHHNTSTSSPRFTKRVYQWEMNHIWHTRLSYYSLLLRLLVFPCIHGYFPRHGTPVETHWSIVDRSWLVRRRSAAARLLGLRFRIPPGAWMFVCCERCVLSGRGLCDELSTRPEESYRLWCVVVCDLKASWMRSHIQSIVIVLNL